MKYPYSLLRASFYIGGAYFVVVAKEGVIVSFPPFPGLPVLQRNREAGSWNGGRGSVGTGFEVMGREEVLRINGAIVSEM